MKKYDEMARDVLDRIGEYEAERKLKRIRTAKIAAALTPVCTAAVVGGGIWLSGAFMHADKPAPADSGIISEGVTVTESSNAPSESSAAAVTEKTTKHEEQGTAEGTSTEEVTSAETEETAPSESAVQTETAARQTTAAAATTAAPRTTQSSAAEQTTPNNGGGDKMLWCIFFSSIEWNGQTYYDNDIASIYAYTQDSYLGKVKDFAGEYDDKFNYRIAPEDSVYTVKETSDVLYVVKADSNSPYGSVVLMTNSSWSLEKYEPERLDPNYIDPNAPDEAVVYNGCIF